MEKHKKANAKTNLGKLARYMSGLHADQKSPLSNTVAPDPCP
jgi:hypothetical protein